MRVAADRATPDGERRVAELPLADDEAPAGLLECRPKQSAVPWQRRQGRTVIRAKRQLHRDQAQSECV
jgi:hypothetical protein